MYSWEIDQMLRDNNFVINKDQYAELCPQKNPQTSRLTYDTSSNIFHLYTYDGYNWEFKVVND